MKGQEGTVTMESQAAEPQGFPSVVPGGPLQVAHHGVRGSDALRRSASPRAVPKEPFPQQQQGHRHTREGTRMVRMLHPVWETIGHFPTTYPACCSLPLPQSMPSPGPSPCLPFSRVCFLTRTAFLRISAPEVSYSSGAASSGCQDLVWLLIYVRHQPPLDGSTSSRTP